MAIPESESTLDGWFASGLTPTPTQWQALIRTHFYKVQEVFGTMRGALADTDISTHFNPFALIRFKTILSGPTYQVDRALGISSGWIQPGNSLVGPYVDLTFSNPPPDENYLVLWQISGGNYYPAEEVRTPTTFRGKFDFPSVTLQLFFVA